MQHKHNVIIFVFILHNLSTILKAQSARPKAFIKKNILKTMSKLKIGDIVIINSEYAKMKEVGLSGSYSPILMNIKGINNEEKSLDLIWFDIHGNLLESILRIELFSLHLNELNIVG